jgi:hypothetical protein
MKMWKRISQTHQEKASSANAYCRPKTFVDGGSFRVVAVMVSVDDDGKASIYNRHGQCITSVDIDQVAGLPSIEDVKWMAWVSASQSNLRSDYNTRVNTEDHWLSRALGMHSSWRHRIKGINRVKSKPRNIRKPPTSWEESVRQMMCAASDDKENFKSRKGNGFLCWAKSATRNANRRAKERYEG